MGRAKKQSSEETSEAMATDTSSGSGVPKKTEMVRQAMNQGKRKPLEIQGWIRDTYKEEVSTQHISSIKTNLRKAKGGKRGRKPADATSSGPRQNGTGMLSLAEMRQVKGMVERIGKDKFQQLLDLLT